MRKSATAVALAATALFGTAGLAQATGSGTVPSLVTTGASFTQGVWWFDPWPCNSSCYKGQFSGFNYHGYLNDTQADGNAPKVHGKVDGYDWGPDHYNKNGNGTRVYVSEKLFDRNGDPSTGAQLQVCRDRGSLLPDNCKSSPVFSR
jgi:hypothetical protein